MKLPSHVGPIPDVDDFLTKFRVMELPPRPIFDERSTVDRDGFDQVNAEEMEISENEVAESDLRDNLALTDSFRKRRRIW